MSPPPPDAAAIKERERATWTWASEGWRLHDRTLMAFSRPVTDELVRRAGIAPGMRVLDLASGTGEPSLTVAERVGPTGSVLGFDLVEPMIAVAREKAAQRHLTNVEYRIGDAEALSLPPSSFDAATMRWGIMFLPDPLAALRAVHRALRPGARFALAVWGPAEKNDFLRLPLDVLRRHTEVPSPPPGSPGIFAFADPARLPTALAEAGFSKTESMPLPLPNREFRSGAEYWTFQKAIAAPITRLFDALPPAERPIVDAEIVEAADKFRGPNGLELSGLAYVGWGTR